MSIIHTYITRQQVKRLSQQDNDYFRRKLNDNCVLNTLLHKHINKALLAELLCVLDNKPIVRQIIDQSRSASKVMVYQGREGKLIRIENGNGTVYKNMVEEEQDNGNNG